jgi:spectinomycin phosphotransferase
MLEEPVLDMNIIKHCLEAEYGLRVEDVTFLPLGADLNTAVFRVETYDTQAYFLKLRRGKFDEASVAVPRYLSDTGLRRVVSPLTTSSGRLWTEMDSYHVVLYPYIDGRHGFERPLTDQQWVEFGAALKRFHKANFPSAVTSGVPRETFSPQWRQKVMEFLERSKTDTFAEPVAIEVAAFLKTKAVEIIDLVERAEWLAQKLISQRPEVILCHADIHAWNLLVVDQVTFYMVDWDTLIFAPKERDLMFVGGGLGGNRHAPEVEEALFYQGYGQIQINSYALAYYRYERIIEDIAVFCEQIFLSDGGGEDRYQALAYLKSNFLRNGVIEMAHRSDKTLREE